MQNESNKLFVKMFKLRNKLKLINIEKDKYKQALNEIEKIASKQRKFDLTGKTPLTPVINEVGGDFIDILDIINTTKNNRNE